MEKTIKRSILQITLCALTMLSISCVKKTNTTNNNSSTVTDIDGNVYHTVNIGGQIWMKENLNTTKYRNGDPIPNVSDYTDWSYLTTGAYCDYNNLPANSATYGRLYNWYAVNSGLLCPVGWHVPSEAEWTALETFVGTASPGGKLKETGTAHWYSPNAGATNESGWTGLPGGSRFSTGSFYNLTYNGYWWSATEGSDISYARYHFLDFNLTFIYGDEDYKVDGISVRCIKD
ncbi:MAG: hypothetical protein JWN78_2841 [Bacteroidota bacterium]|nr:hypothetical protein [Bacteroidota bacterium]